MIKIFFFFFKYDLGNEGPDLKKIDVFTTRLEFFPTLGKKRFNLKGKKGNEKCEAFLIKPGVKRAPN